LSSEALFHEANAVAGAGRFQDLAPVASGPLMPYIPRETSRRARMIKVGDKLPDATFTVPTPEGLKQMQTAEIFAGKRVALFAVPGAFTPTCSARHLPSFRDKAPDLRGKGIDLIACLSVNDGHVMRAWAQDQNVADDMVMLADGNGDFAKAVGLDSDFSKF